LRFRVSGFRVRCFGFRVSGFGFRACKVDLLRLTCSLHLSVIFLPVPPKIRRGAIAKVNFSNFRGNTRQTWRFQDVEYLRGSPRPGCFLQLLRVKSRVKQIRSSLSAKPLLNQSYLTECISELTLESQIPHKIVNLMSKSVITNNKLTILWGS